MEYDPPKSLYVHVPFCLGKCGYCDFYSVVVSPEGVEAYLRALETELELTAGDREQPFDTLYVGGGTPTSLAAGRLDTLLSMLHERFDLARDVEFSVEANPGTLSREKLDILKAHGVNRLSIGAQSFDDRLLAVLGRRHRRCDILDAVAEARESGFHNISLDLIFGIPTQSVGDWARDIKLVLSCDVSHVSTYALTYEGDTPLVRQEAAGEIKRVSEEDELRMFETAIDTLSANGYEHYEVSNFARAGFGCRHNETYWANEPYLGLGPSAVSYVGGVRRRNVASIEDYATILGAGRLPVAFRECLSGEKRARETAVMNLRRTSGLNFDEWRRHTGFHAREFFQKEFQVFAADGLMEITERSAKLTRRGLMVADSVLSDLV